VSETEKSAEMVTVGEPDSLEVADGDADADGDIVSQAENDGLAVAEALNDVPPVSVDAAD
jgi:hypothetical protein